jgi:hypothetical protein
MLLQNTSVHLQYYVVSQPRKPQYKERKFQEDLTIYFPLIQHGLCRTKELGEGTMTCRQQGDPMSLCDMTQIQQKTMKFGDRHTDSKAIL